MTDNIMAPDNNVFQKTKNNLLLLGSTILHIIPIKFIIVIV